MDPYHAQGRLGLQRHGTPRRRVSGRCAGRPERRRACRLSPFTDKTCRTPTDTTIPEDVAEKILRFVPRRPRRSHRCAAKGYLSHRRRAPWASPVPLWTRVFLGKLSGHPRTGRGHDGSAPPHRPKASMTKRNIDLAHAMGVNPSLEGAEDKNRRTLQRTTEQKAAELGVRACKMALHHPGYHARQSQAARRWP